MKVLESNNFFDKIINWVKGNIIDPSSKFIEDLIPALKGYGAYVFGGLVLLVLLLIIIIIAVSVSKSKKKKARKLAAKKLSEINEADLFEEEPEEAKEEVVSFENNEDEVPFVDEKISSNDKLEEQSMPESLPEEVKETVEEETKDDETSIEPVVENNEKQEENVMETEEEKLPPIKKSPVSKKKTTEEKEELKSKVKSEEKTPKRKREKSGPKEIDLDFVPDRVIPEPENEKINEVVVAKETVKEENVEKKKASPKKEVLPATEPEAKKEKKGVQGKYILVREGNTNWRYKLKASNGEIIIVSESYTSEKSVRTGIETLKKNLDSSKLEFVEDKHGLFYFMVLTKQGRCLATSATYKTKARATSASESYRRWAETDVVVIAEEDSEHTEVEKIEVEVEEVNTGKFIITKENEGFYYKLVAANGVVVATSQYYKSKDSCLKACETFRACVYKGDFFISRDKNDLYQFKLYNKQNRLVLAGEVYKEKARAISVIETIKRLAKHASLIEN